MNKDRISTRESDEWDLACVSCGEEWLSLAARDVIVKLRTHKCKPSG